MRSALVDAGALTPRRSRISSNAASAFSTLPGAPRTDKTSPAPENLHAEFLLQRAQVLVVLAEEKEGFLGTGKVDFLVTTRTI